MSFITGLIIGLVLGAPIGMFTLALLAIAAGADRMNDYELDGRNRNE